MLPLLLMVGAATPKRCEEHQQCQKFKPIRNLNASTKHVESTGIRLNGMGYC